MISNIRKRDGRIVEFDRNKIAKAIQKAVQAVGAEDGETVEELVGQVVESLERSLKPDEIPSVEQVQDVVEQVLVDNGDYRIARAYICYRELHAQAREFVDEYLERRTWLVKENSNMTYSLQALNFHISSQVISQYWLHKIYKPKPEIGKSHVEGDFHIHDLAVLGPYCVGWDLQDLLSTGFKGVRGKISSKPARHFRTILGQIVNFFFTLQGESAGAQAFSNLDTYLAPFIRYDDLNHEAVKQCLQEFMFNMNVPTRVGFQTPFTNITLDLEVPKFIENQPVIVGGEAMDDTYADFQEEMNIFNAALADVMLEGDAVGRVFTFPIPTINITKQFGWNNDVNEKIFQIAAKYGIPYFANFVNSEMDPEDVRSMCCHLRLDKRELKKRGGGLFGSNPLTGSIGVVTINMPRLGFLSRDETIFFELLEDRMELSKEALEIKREWLERFTEKDLYPYSKFYLRGIKEGFDSYWENHFNTIGIIGMNEACLNLLNCSIGDKEGRKFSEKTLEFMRKRLQDFQEETGDIYNLEATPAEGSSYRLAKLDKQKYPEIIVANDEEVKKGAEPYYTNSSQLPVYFTDDLWEALKLQDPLQVKYTGGTVFHIWLGESNPPTSSVKILVKRICENFRLPYFTLTPTFSICPRHGYVLGEHQTCPTCEIEGKETQCEVYSRTVGYLRPVEQWNEGKKEEFKQRKNYDKALQYSNLKQGVLKTS